MLDLRINNVEKADAIYNNVSVTVMKRLTEMNTIKKQEYLAMIDRGLKQMKEGGGKTVTDEEMEMMLNE